MEFLVKRFALYPIGQLLDVVTGEADVVVQDVVESRA